jgi:four helix bundle protein
VPTTVKTFRDLIAWQKAIKLAGKIYEVTARMPDSERFGLTAQMRRAAVSVPSNIAEGHGRQSRVDYLRFLRMARGSLMELQTQLILCEKLGFLTPSAELSELLAEADRVLQGLIRGLEKLNNQATEPRSDGATKG